MAWRLQLPDHSAQVNKAAKPLRAVDDTIKAGAFVRVSIRRLLSWFGFHRRGKWVERTIKQELNKRELTTHPDFRRPRSINTIVAVWRQRSG